MNVRETYIVRLDDEECNELENIVKKLKGTSQRVKRAIVLLKADADGPNWTNEKIADRTGMTNKAISNLRKKLVIEGFDAVEPIHHVPKNLMANKKPKSLPCVAEHRRKALGNGHSGSLRNVLLN